jgi:hypothetical protein
MSTDTHTERLGPMVPAVVHSPKQRIAADGMILRVQGQVLRERIVPSVAAAPGFVSAYWGLAPDAAESVSFVLFDERAAAESFAAYVGSDPQGRGSDGVGGAEPLAVYEISAVA